MKRRPGSRAIGLAVLVLVQLAFTGFAAWLVVGLLRPCTDNFEGGCGYGKAIAGVLSWLSALFGAGMGTAVTAIAWRPGAGRRLAFFTGGLAVVAMGYVVYGVVVAAVTFAR